MNREASHLLDTRQIRVRIKSFNISHEQVLHARDWAKRESVSERAWRLYLADSVVTFTLGQLQLYQVLFARSGRQPLPMTYDFIIVTCIAEGPHADMFAALPNSYGKLGHILRTKS